MGIHNTCNFTIRVITCLSWGKRRQQRNWYHALHMRRDVRPCKESTSRYNIAPHHTILHYTTLHYTTLHYTTLHYTTLHCTALHCTALHKIQLLDFKHSTASRQPAEVTMRLVWRSYTSPQANLIDKIQHTYHIMQMANYYIHCTHYKTKHTLHPLSLTSIMCTGLRHKRQY